MPDVPVNIFETDSEVIVAAAMPGVQPEDISVRLKGHTLELQSRERGKKATGKYLLQEWYYGPYDREIPLETPVDAQRANVSYGNGVLMIALPRARDFVEAELSLDKVGQARGSTVGHAH